MLTKNPPVFGGFCCVLEGELLYPSLGDERVDQRLNNAFIGIGHFFDGPELVQQLLVAQRALGQLIGGAVGQVVRGDPQHIGQLGQHIRRGLCALVLVPSYLRVVDPRQVPQLRLG